MSFSSLPPSFAGALPEAFAELRRVVDARAPGGWARVLAHVSEPARLAGSQPIEVVSDAVWVESLDVAEQIVGDDDGTLARAVGVARAEARLAELAAKWDGDPLGFLRAGGATFYRDRATYGAASLELRARHAMLRLVASTWWLRRGDGRPSWAPLVALGYFDHAVARLAGAPHRGRYVGHARRADALAGVALCNLIYEYDLDDV